MARRHTRDLIQWRDDAGGWYENFTVNGRRFRRSLGTDQQSEAEQRAAKSYAAALAGAPADAPAAARAVLPAQQTLSHVLGRYWLEHGQFLGTADDIARYGRQLSAGLGRDRQVAALTAEEIARYAARRRATLANRSVNVELVHLRAVLNRARDMWAVPVPPLPWAKLFLEESGEREHILSEEEETRFFAALRPDFHPMVRFTLLTGMRLANVVGLRWRQIDRDAGVIRLQVKSKKPGGDLHYLPISRAVGAILDGERGRDFEHVFTYVCQRSRHEPRHGIRMDRGARYPFTHDGWRAEWKRALAAAGIEDFRFHDLRHTAATRTLRATPNLQLVQKLLGHRDISTTLRYTKADLGDVRAAMDRAAGAAASPTRVSELPQTPAIGGKKRK